MTSRALDFKGIVGKVSLDGTDITSPAGGWNHVVGLAGEHIGAASGNVSLPWAACSGASGPLTWRKTTFSLSPATVADINVSVMLDVSGMSRGHFYLNGVDLGKFWTVGPASLMTQRYYQLPRSVLRSHPTENLVVMVDELGAKKPGGVRVVLSTMQPL